MFCYPAFNQAGTHLAGVSPAPLTPRRLTHFLHLLNGASAIPAYLGILMVHRSVKRLPDPGGLSGKALYDAINNASPFKLKSEGVTAEEKLQVLQ